MGIKYKQVAADCGELSIDRLSSEPTLLCLDVHVYSLVQRKGYNKINKQLKLHAALNRPVAINTIHIFQKKRLAVPDRVTSEWSRSNMRYFLDRLFQTD